MKGIWNNCFFCLTDLSKVSSADKVNLSSKVVTNIKQLIASSGTPTSDGNCEKDKPKLFCDNCVAQIETVFFLHQQLEVLQLKLVDALKSVKTTVIKNSKEKAPKKTLNQLKKFEAWLKTNDEGGLDHDVKFEGGVEEGKLNEEKTQRLQQRKILDTLYAFHDGIIAKDKQSIDIPLVYLSKYSPKPAVPSLTIIKPEPSTLPALDPDPSDLIDFPGDDDDYFLDNPPSSPPSPSSSKKPISKKRKPGRPRRDPSLPKRKSSYIKKLVKLPTNPGKIGRPKTKPPPPPHDPSIVPRQKVRVKRLASFRLKPHSHKTNHRPRILLACDLCPFTTPTSYQFEFHLRSHEVPIQDDTKIPVYTCDLCENGTGPRYTVKQHYEFHMAAHQGYQTILCEVCNLMVSPITLEAHLKTHPEIEKIFSCKSCSFCCSSREAFLDHLKYHKSDEMDCDICGKIVMGKRKLLKHLFEVHQVIDKVVCGIDGCTNAYLDKDTLTIHKRTHTVAWRCKFCEKGFSCNAALQMHLRTHTGDKPFQCDQCPETFSVKSYLSRHMISKHDAPKFQCEFCDKGYTDMGSLRAHHILHKGTGFFCDHCGKMFGSRTQLGRHMQSHAQERKFICDECGSGFKTQQVLNTHVKTHSGEKKWKCGYCDRAFLFNKYLIQHVRIHTGERPYRCKNCDQGFTQAGPLKQHELSCQRIPPASKFDRSSP